MTTVWGYADSAFDFIEGNRIFDITWGALAGLLCLAVAVPLVIWTLQRYATWVFTPAIDPARYLQFGWGLFGMFLGFTNAGCRFIDHHHLDWVHPGFFALTVLYVSAFGPRVFVLIRRQLHGAPSAGRVGRLAGDAGPSIGSA